MGLLPALQVLSDGGQSFKKRAKEIADLANNSRGTLAEGAEFLRGLDEEERKRWSSKSASD